jgi:hypothetical protein
MRRTVTLKSWMRCGNMGLRPVPDALNADLQGGFQRETRGIVQQGVVVFEGGAFLLFWACAPTAAA